MTKEDFATLATRFERVGLLPKGKTADLLENYDFVVQQIADEAAAAASDIPPAKLSVSKGKAAE